MKKNSGHIKKRVFDIIQIGNTNDIVSRLFDIFITVVIIASLAATILMTYDELSEYRGVLEDDDLITVIIFTIEYLHRLWTASYLFPKKSFWGAKLAFVVSFYGLIDLLSILPTYLPIVFPAGAVAFRRRRRTAGGLRRAPRAGGPGPCPSRRLRAHRRCSASSPSCRR